MLLLRDERSEIDGRIEAMSDLDLAGPCRPRLRPPCRRPTCGRRAASPPCSTGPDCRRSRLAVPAMARSRSASGKTIAGDLPPSSSETRLRLPAAALTMSLPTSVEPVKATLSTSGCSANAAPAVSPKPVTMLTTPSGMPASAISSPRRSAESGVCSAGLSTIVQPAASAGASFHAAIISGKFHGMICPTTPTGSRNV